MVIEDLARVIPTHWLPVGEPDQGYPSYPTTEEKNARKVFSLDHGGYKFWDVGDWQLANGKGIIGKLSKKNTGKVFWFQKQGKVFCGGNKLWDNHFSFMAPATASNGNRQQLLSIFDNFQLWVKQRCFEIGVCKRPLFLTMII